MEKLEIKSFFNTWYKLDYEVAWINYVCIEENDNDSYLFFSFYADYPVFEEKEKLCPLSKRKWIEKILKYQKLKNEDIFNWEYHYLNPEEITMKDILEILKYYKII